MTWHNLRAFALQGNHTMSDKALPPHMRGRKHNDWFFFKNTPRGWNAKGPREEKGAKDYAAWPPRLVKGKNVCRWESDGAQSIIFIPELLTNKEINGRDIYGREWEVIEMNPSSEDFQKKKKIRIPYWEESVVTDLKREDGTYEQIVAPMQYSPSALQKFSKNGWMKLEPDYFSSWKVLKKRELPVWPETGDDTVLFMRSGHRPDHVDCYYNVDKLIPIGFIGLKWE